jgi:Domain of unknown function (DUF4136)
MQFRLMAPAAAGALALSACGPAPQVRTTVAPDAGTSGHLTFQLRAAPDYLGGTPIGANHPIRISSDANRTLGHDIATNLARRGYVQAGAEAGVLIVFRIAQPAHQDVTAWDSGYLWRPDWARGVGAGAVNLSPAEYSGGAVVIDMIDPRTGALLWRGQKVTSTPADERRYLRELRQTVTAILDRVPEPSMALNQAVGLGVAR